MHMQTRSYTAAICLLLGLLLLMPLMIRPAGPDGDRASTPRAGSECEGSRCFQWPDSKRIGFGQGSIAAADGRFERDTKARWSAEIVQVR